MQPHNMQSNVNDTMLNMTAMEMNGLVERTLSHMHKCVNTRHMVYLPRIKLNAVIIWPMAVSGILDVAAISKSMTKIKFVAGIRETAAEMAGKGFP
jgi:hypothetical protein